MKKRIKALLLRVNLLAMIALSVPAYADEWKVYQIDLPAQSCAESLARLSEIADVMLLFPSKVAESIKANPVKGNYTLSEALDIMLEGTGFTGSLSEKGVLMISLEKSINNNRVTNEGKEGEMKTSRKNTVLAAILGFMFGAGSTDLAAQDSGESSMGMDTGRKLEEIVVTAQKRSESLQDVPIAVSAFSGDQLAKLGVTGTQALQNTTPGLVFNNTGPGAQPYLRGVGTRFSNAGLEASISTYIDDRYVQTPHTAMFDFADVERVEVLKGPQGTLYGRNSTGGTLRVITKDVEEELEGSLTATAGNYDHFGFKGTVNLPVTEDFGMRLSGITLQRDGYSDNLWPAGPSELDDQDYQAIRSKFRWDVTDDVAARLTLEYWEREDRGNSDIVNLSPNPAWTRGVSLGGLASTQPGTVYTEYKDNIDIDEFAGQFRLDASFDYFDFASITVYSDVDVQSMQDVDSTNLTLLGVTTFADDQLFTQEFQLTSNLDGNLEWVTGIYFLESNRTWETTLNNALSVGNQIVDTSSWSLYGQTTWKFSENWALTLGGRYSTEEKEVELVASEIYPTNPALLPALPYRDEDDWSEFTPKATLEYRFDQGMVYFTYARGFKSGGFNIPALGAPVLDSEILDMYEIGFKSELMDNHLRLNASVYYYDYQDLQVASAALNLPVAVLKNAADSKIYGFDADLIWLVTDRLTITAGLNVLDTEYENFGANAKQFNAVITGDPTAAGMSDVFFDASGEDMLRVADWSGFISLDYEFSLGDATVPVALTYSYKDDYNFDFIVDPTTSGLNQDGYGLLTARVAYVSASEKWSIALWGKNLTDEEYFEDIVAAGQGMRGSYAEPRTYGVDITCNF